MDRRRFTIGLATAAGGAASGAASGAPGASRSAFAAEAGLDALWRRATDGSLPATGRADALLVQRDGRVVYERYGKDHGPRTSHVSWSMAKSFTQALVGIAVGEGKVSLDAPIARAPRLTLRRLLTMTDGLDWNENGYSVVTSDATRMLYGPGRMDGAAYTAAKRQAVPPGTRWAYSTGAIQLAAAALQDGLFPTAKTPDARRAVMRDWITSRLFTPLGLQDATAEFDPSGTFYGGSLVYASARDYARFGQLYLQDGMWNGARILPQGWVAFARTPTRSPEYGAGWWLETPKGSKPASLMGGEGPPDAFSAQGHSGQLIVVIPSRKLVVVRLSVMGDEAANWIALGAWTRAVCDAAMV